MDKPAFDELKRLAERDPHAFEALRTELVEDLILSSSLTNQRRLRGLQFSVDARRDLASNPMKALVDIQTMMHASLDRLNQALQSLSGRSAPEQPDTDSKDNVVLFRRTASSSRVAVDEDLSNR